MRQSAGAGARVSAQTYPSPVARRNGLLLNVMRAWIFDCAPCSRAPLRRRAAALASYPLLGHQPIEDTPGDQRRSRSRDDPLLGTKGHGNDQCQLGNDQCQLGSNPRKRPPAMARTPEPSASMRNS